MTTAPASSDGRLLHRDEAGQDRFGEMVATFDRAVDQAADHLRGRRGFDRVFMTASTLGDFSVLWHIINIVRGLVFRRRPDQVVALGVAIGIESLLVNQGLKRWFRRDRPTWTGGESTPVRRPSTSAFPSGHATAAVFSAVVLSHWDRRLALWWWTLAAIVAMSRVHVRIHHPSDVAGGAVVGFVLGRLALGVLRRLD
jgi:membrane-associated phospholipid phosphatase